MRAPTGRILRQAHDGLHEVSKHLDVRSCRSGGGCGFALRYRRTHHRDQLDDCQFQWRVALHGVDTVSARRRHRACDLGFHRARCCGCCCTRRCSDRRPSGRQSRSTPGCALRLGHAGSAGGRIRLFDRVAVPPRGAARSSRSGALERSRI